MRGVLGSLGVQRVSLVSMAIVFAFVFAVLLGNSFFFYLFLSLVELLNTNGVKMN